MKIALLDLNHLTRGVHNNTVPLGLGLISCYLEKTLGSIFDIRMFKSADKALQAFSSWKPDVLGLAQYSWNSELNLAVARLAKKLNPACLVVAGGPNLELVPARQNRYFQQYPFVDFCIAYDGEIPFTSLIQRFLSGESLESLKQNPVAGSYAYDHASGRLFTAEGPPPRLNSLDAFGAIFAEGRFDEFLDDGYHPFLQTHRGCPFTCAFCHTSDRYYSRMLFQSPEIFRQDLEYLGKRLAGKHGVILYLANTNMSLFAEDFEIAKIIKEVQERYDWPRYLNVNSGKDPQKLLDMLALVDFQPAIALQTLTPEVLVNIKRKNISFSRFVDFQMEVLKKTGEASATELIMCLPGETKASFLATLRTVLNSGVQNVVVYTLMNLKGTPLASEEYEKKYGYLVRHRVVPRQFSRINVEKVLDTEEVIVGTNTMSFEDYLELRGLCFTITTFFSSAELIPLKRLLIEYGIDIFRWVSGIHSQMTMDPEIKIQYDNFIDETKKELFPTREALIEYFEDEENYSGLSSGRFGDNLLRKYKCIILSRKYRQLLRIAINEANILLADKIGETKSSTLLNDLGKYLLFRDVSGLFVDHNPVTEREAIFSYDVPRWITSQNLIFEDSNGEVKYRVKFDEDIHEKAKSFAGMNRDMDLSLQILYRDGTIRDFWPNWIKLD